MYLFLFICLQEAPDNIGSGLIPFDAIKTEPDNTDPAQQPLPPGEDRH